MRWKPQSSILLAASDYGGGVQLWDLRSPGKPLSTKEVHEGKTLCVEWFSVDSGEEGSESSRVVTGGSDCRLNTIALN